MLSTCIIKNISNRTLIFPSSHLPHLFNKKRRCNVILYQRLGFSITSQQPTSILSNKSNSRTSLSGLNCRLIKPDEFTTEFENLVYRRFILEEPMSKYLGETKPDDCVMLFIRQALERAKDDNVSLGIYNDSNNNNNKEHIDKPKETNSNGRQNLPVCFIINYIENIDDPPEKNNIMFDLSKASVENRKKYEYIGDILSKVTENIDLFHEYKARRIMESFLAGIEPEYANQGLFTRLKVASIELARANKCDLIYSKATSQFSTRANLQLGFHATRTIDYNTYQNAKGQHVFSDMSKTHQGCTLTVKDLRI